MEIEFTDKAAKRIRDIREKAGDSSDPETIRNALYLYEWFHEKRAEGFRLIAENDDNRLELVACVNGIETIKIK